MKLKKVITNKYGDYHHVDRKGRRQGEDVGFTLDGSWGWLINYKNNKWEGNSFHFGLYLMTNFKQDKQFGLQIINL